MANRTIYFLAGFFVLVAIVAGIFAFRGRSKGFADSLKGQLEQARKEGLPLEPKDLRPTPVANKDNAGPIYQKVFTRISLVRKSNPRFSTICSNLLTGKFVDPSDRELLKSTLGELRSQLAQVESASKRPKCDFGYRYEEGFNVLMPEFALAKDAARLLCVRAHFEGEAGRYAKAFETLSAADRVAQHMGKVPIIIATLVQVSIEQIALNEFRVLLNRSKGNRSSLDGAERFLKSQGPLVDLRRPFGGEVVMGRVTLKTVRNMGQIKELSSGQPSPDSAPITDSLREGFESALMHYWRKGFKILDAKGKSWADLTAEFERLDKEVEADQSPTNVMTLIMFPNMAGISGSVCRQQTNRRLAGSAVRLLRARQVKGEFPIGLPKFGEISIDPFSDAPFYYNRRGHGFVIYSVGRDGADNGGSPQRGATPGDIAWNFD